MLKVIHMLIQQEFHSKQEVNNKDPKFKFVNHVKISKYKNIFAKKIEDKLV